MIDKTWTEFGKEMGVNEATVRSYFNRGVKKLKRNRIYRREYDIYRTYISDRDKFNNLKGRV